MPVQMLDTCRFRYKSFIPVIAEVRYFKDKLELQRTTGRQIASIVSRGSIISLSTQARQIRSTEEQTRSLAKLGAPNAFLQSLH